MYYNIMYITHWPKEAEYTVVSATVYLPTISTSMGKWCKMATLLTVNRPSLYSRPWGSITERTVKALRT